MWERIKTWWLRRRARKLYLYLLSIYDSVDCGASLVEYMNPQFKFKRKKMLALCRLVQWRQMRLVPVPVRKQ